MEFAEWQLLPIGSEYATAGHEGELSWGTGADSRDYDIQIHTADSWDLQEGKR